jgi:DNA-directed RNA polymerase subunit RPC12/RpoP
MKDIIPSAEERQDIHQRLRDLPDNESIFKCQSCKHIFNIYSEGLTIFAALMPKNSVRCPNCKTYSTELMCRVDTYSLWLKLKGFNCRKGELISGADICPICKTAMCPECGNHNCISLSRVTGYIQDVSGWNAAKKQELLDRKRYSLRRSN